MRYWSLVIVSFISLWTTILAQSDSTTSYRNLKSKKFYAVSLSSSSKDGKSEYWVNDRKVSRAKYKRYESFWENMETCCPCILKSYDQDDVLLSEAVVCTDCGIGKFKEYFPNGNVKLSGCYKEFSSNDWDELWDGEHCNIPDGQWTYFSSTGDTLYSEFWDEGIFLRQSPEQMENEAWRVELTLDGLPIIDRVLTANQLKQIEIVPRYKNTSDLKGDIKVEFQVSSQGYRSVKEVYTIESFSTVDVLALMKEAGIPSDRECIFTITVYEGGRLLEYFFPIIAH